MRINYVSSRGGSSWGPNRAMARPFLCIFFQDLVWIWPNNKRWPTKQATGPFLILFHAPPLVSSITDSIKQKKGKKRKREKCQRESPPKITKSAVLKRYAPIFLPYGSQMQKQAKASGINFLIKICSVNSSDKHKHDYTNKFVVQNIFHSSDVDLIILLFQVCWTKSNM